MRVTYPNNIWGSYKQLTHCLLITFTVGQVGVYSVPTVSDGYTTKIVIKKFLYKLCN